MLYPVFLPSQPSYGSPTLFGPPCRTASQGKSHDVSHLIWARLPSMVILFGNKKMIYGFFRSLKMRIWGYALPTPKSCFLHNVVIFTLQPVLVWIFVPEVNDNGCSQKGWFLHRGVSLNMVGVTVEPKLFLWWRMMAYTNKHYLAISWVFTQALLLTYCPSVCKQYIALT